MKKRLAPADFKLENVAGYKYLSYKDGESDILIMRDYLFATPGYVIGRYRNGIRLGSLAVVAPQVGDAPLDCFRRAINHANLMVLTGSTEGNIEMMYSVV